MPAVFKELKKGTVMLMRPNYVPCIFEKVLPDGNCLITFSNKQLKIPKTDCCVVQVPVYNHDQRGQKFEVFHEKSKKWIECRLVDIVENGKTCQVKDLANNQTLEVTRMLLRPINSVVPKKTQ